MNSEREESIRKGLLAVSQGHLSLYQAAQQFNLPESTLRYRMKNNNTTRQESRESLKLLSSEQEKQLADWCIEKAYAGSPVTHKDLRLQAREILVQKGNTEAKVGRDWVKSFLRRNPSVKSGNRNKILPAEIVDEAEGNLHDPNCLENSNDLDSDTNMNDIQECEEPGSGTFHNNTENFENTKTSIPKPASTAGNSQYSMSMLGKVMTSNLAAKSPSSDLGLAEEKEKAIETLGSVFEISTELKKCLDPNNPAHDKIKDQMEVFGMSLITTTLKYLQTKEKCQILEKRVVELENQLNEKEKS